MDPFGKARFKSKSYTAYVLRGGINWSQMLGLGEIESTRKQMALPEDNMDPMGIEVRLPPMVRLDGDKVAFTSPLMRGLQEGGNIPIVDADGRKLLTDFDDSVMYYPQCSEDHKVSAVENNYTDDDLLVGDEDEMKVHHHSGTNYKPFAKVYRNKVDFEEELINLGDQAAQIEHN